jgi:hypothetical protein
LEAEKSQVDGKNIKFKSKSLECRYFFWEFSNFVARISMSNTEINVISNETSFFIKVHTPNLPKPQSFSPATTKQPQKNSFAQQ